RSAAADTKRDLQIRDQPRADGLSDQEGPSAPARDRQWRLAGHRNPVDALLSARQGRQRHDLPRRNAPVGTDPAHIPKSFLNSAFHGAAAGIAFVQGPQTSLKTSRWPGEEIMAEASILQVSRLLDERGLSAFQIKLLVWSFFIVLIDGYDIAAIAFAAPHLVRSWGVAPNALGPVFSASLIGILFGSAIFGWVG